MAYTIKYYLHYGIFGRQLFNTIISWGTARKVALAVWIAVTLAELFVLWRVHKKGGCTDEKISRPARENGRNCGGLRRVKGDPHNTVLRFHSRPTNKKCIMALAQMMKEQYGNQIAGWYGDAVGSETE